MLDLQTLQALYAACNPDEALSPDDPRFVDIDRVTESGATPPRGERWTDILWKKITLGSDAPQCLLFSGLRGSGKTTELRRLVARFERDEYLVVSIDARVHLDLNTPLHISELLLLMLHKTELAVRVAANDAPDQERAFLRLWNWFLGVDEGREVPGIRALAPTPDGAAIVHQLEARTPLRERIRAVVEDHPTAFLEEVRLGFGLLDRRAKEMGRRALVVIVDSLEQLQGISDNWQAVVDTAERLFSSAAIVLPVHTVYTVPPGVALLLRRDVTFIPMVKLHANDAARTPHEPGYAVLRELVDRRIPSDELCDLFGDDRTERCVRALIAASGGYPRALMELLRDVILAVPDGVTTQPAITDRLLQRILARASSRARGLLNVEGEPARALLRRVARTRELSTDTLAERHLASKLLDRGLILRYLNDEEWWDVHPSVRDALGEDP